MVVLRDTPWAAVVRAFAGGTASMEQLAEATVMHITRKVQGNSRLGLSDDVPSWPQEGTVEEIRAAVDDGLIPEALATRLVTLASTAMRARAAG